MGFKDFVLRCLCFLLLLFDNTHGSVISGNMKTNWSSVRLDPTRVKQLSWNPRVFMYKGFLSDKECDHLIALAKDKLKRALVVGTTGTGSLSEQRTSSGMFIPKNEDETVTNIEKKIAAWTFLPPENGELMQILRYEQGQKYEPHRDAFNENMSKLLGGNRVATVLMYLSNVQRGGETVFPRAEGKMQQPKDNTWSECAKKGYSVKPAKGDALLFFNLHLNGSVNLNSLHGSCPVIEGEKWSATKWIHVRPFERSKDGCTDENVNCAMWAEDGECDKNPLYMVGSKDVVGYCRRSCKAC